MRELADEYIAGQPTGMRDDLLALQRLVARLAPDCTVWFLDGKDEHGKTVTNPSIGFGERRLPLAKGRSRPFYRVGFSANSSGISVYIMGLTDKTHLPRTYSDTIGKAKVTGYCITFRHLADVDITVLEAAIRDGLEEPDLE